MDDDDAARGRKDGPPSGKQAVKSGGGFAQVGLDELGCAAVRRLGFSSPTPIQRQVIPAILAGSDVVAMARTGSGKTAAFVLPLVQRLREHSLRVGIRALILEPSRELAFQVARVLRVATKRTLLRTCVLVGGHQLEKQFERLSNNPDIVVAAPGRLLHHMTESRLSLSAVEVLVLDEADQLFDESQFQDQVGSIVAAATNPGRQFVLTSATLPSSLIEFTSLRIKSPTFIRQDANGEVSEQLENWFLYSRSEEKLGGLILVLREVGKAGVILFVASRFHCEYLRALLSHMRFSCTTIYGKLDQVARQENLAAFRRGEKKILIVTDVAARGLDLPDAEWIINYDFPLSPKIFVHRVGRTARNGRSGRAVTFITREDLGPLVETLLFTGLKLASPPVTDAELLTARISTLMFSTADALRQPSHLGGLPDVSEELEAVREAALTDAEIGSLQGLMIKAMQHYQATRPSPSEQSVRRAKDLLKLFGGPVGLLSSHVHPALTHLQTSKDRDPDFQRFVHQLHELTPADTAKVETQRGSRRGGVLPSSAVQGMKRRHAGVELRAEIAERTKLERRSGDDELLSDDEEEDDDDHGPIARKTVAAVAAAAAPALPDKMQIFDWQSRTGSRHLVSLSPKKEAADSEALQRWKNFDGAPVAAKEGLVQMRKAVVDFADDETLKMKKRPPPREAKRWNRLTKKFVSLPVSSDGTVLNSKNAKRRNEAGALVRGELKKRGVYERWARLTRRQIQKPGEKEDTSQMPSWLAAEKKPARRVERPVDPPSIPLSKRLAAMTRDQTLVDAVSRGATLTAKQQRKVRKLLRQEAEPVRTGAREGGDLLQARDVMKRKKQELQKKAKHDEKLRRKLSREGKAKHMAKRARQAVEKGARPRSFKLVMGAGKRGATKRPVRGKGRA